MQITDGNGKLILLGPDSSVKQMLLDALKQSTVGQVVCAQESAGRAAGTSERQTGDVVCAQQSAGLTREDRVLLFGQYGAGDSAADGKWIEELMDAIGQIQKVSPRKVLFLSDTMVYGTLFGEQRLLGEEELGYVCHTSADGMTAHWMRTAEHLCARLAREEGVPVKIVRADWAHIPALLRAEGGSGTILDSILNILEDGADGEAYNLSGLTREGLLRKNEECAKARSPLMPVTVIPDIGKAEHYAAS